MPLSERERRALEELEAQLSAEDPRFASAMVADPSRASKRRRVFLGVLGVVVGLGVLVLAVRLKQPWISVAGFVAMVFGVVYATSPTRSGAFLRSVDGGGESDARQARGAARPKGEKVRRSRANGDFMNRLEDRWERRRRENQGW